MAPESMDSDSRSLELRFQSFRGPDTTVCFRQAAAALGDDAVALRTVIHRNAPPTLRAEIVAAEAVTVERFRRRITPAPLSRPRRDEVRDSGPLVIALVGSAGAGKSTSAARLVSHEAAFGGWRAGLISLDTRPGALERLHPYAHAAGVPLEVVHEPSQVTGAVRRLMKARCDVLVVDTPGQGPRADALEQRWTASLRALNPTEVHLVVQATMRADLAAHARAGASSLGVTHTLITRLDELPGNAGLPELAAAVGLPVRWTGEGQDVCSDLREGASRVLGALGVASVVTPAPLVATPRAAAGDDADSAAEPGARTTDRAASNPPGAFSFLTRRRSIAASR